MKTTRRLPFQDLWIFLEAVTYLGSSLLVVVLVGHSVDLEAVALQGAALGEGLLAQVALVRPHAWI
jgi:hypothetical protein